MNSNSQFLSYFTDNFLYYFFVSFIYKIWGRLDYTSENVNTKQWHLFLILGRALRGRGALRCGSKTSVVTFQESGPAQSRATRSIVTLDPTCVSMGAFGEITLLGSYRKSSFW